MSDTCSVMLEDSPCGRPVKWTNTDGSHVCGYHKDGDATPINELADGMMWGKTLTGELVQRPRR